MNAEDTNHTQSKFLRAIFNRFLTLSQTVFAQVLRRHKAIDSEKAPKIVLVELFSAASRMNRIESVEMKANLAEAMAQFNDRVLNDFGDHFNYCPVCFFYDSNMLAIQNRDWEGRLIDKNGGIASSQIVKKTDTNFFILYYGNLVPDESTPFDIHVSKKMLVALNYQGKLLPYPLPRTESPGLFDDFKSKEFVARYCYSNPETDTYYSACAKEYSDLLRKFYGPYPYKREGH